MGSISPLEKKPRNKCRKWRMYVSCGKDEYGRRIQRSKRVVGTYTEAKAELVKFENECLGITSRDVKFADFAENYVERRKPLLKESTYTSRVSVVKTLIKIFGRDVKLSQMTSSLIEQKMNALLVNGVRDGVKPKPCKPSYVASLYTYLSSIMLDAVKKGIIMRNPCDGAKRPNGKPEEREAPTIAMLQALIEDMDVHSRHETAVLLQASLGLRRGESLALRWQDVDFENGIIHIRHNIAANCVLTSPKTPSSRRDLPMPSFLSDALRDRLAIVERDIRRSLRGELLSTEPDIGDVFVCCDEMGRPCGPSAQTCWWANHRDRFGMSGYTEHDIRHGYLTALAKSGVHPKTMQALAGHATATITLEIYSHVELNDKQAASGVFEQAIKAAKKTEGK